MNRRLLLLPLCLALAGCWGGHLDPISNEADTAMISGTGTMQHQDLEGGFFGIVGDDSVKYDPVAVAPEFQKDGLRVKFKARPANATMASTRMWGVRVELASIAVLPPPPPPKSK